METTKNRIRRSEALTPEEHERFKEYVGSFPTKVDAMEALETTWPTLDRIILKGSGRPASIEKIRKAINQ